MTLEAGLLLPPVHTCGRCARLEAALDMERKIAGEQLNEMVARLVTLESNERLHREAVQSLIEYVEAQKRVIAKLATI